MALQGSPMTPKIPPIERYAFSDSKLYLQKKIQLRKISIKEKSNFLFSYFFDIKGMNSGDFHFNVKKYETKKLKFSLVENFFVGVASKIDRDC